MIIDNLKKIIEDKSKKSVFTTRSENDSFNNNSYYLSVDNIDYLRLKLNGSISFSGSSLDMERDLQGVKDLVLIGSQNTTQSIFNEDIVYVQDIVYFFNKDLIQPSEFRVNKISTT